MQVLKVGLIASAGMKSMHVKGSESALISGVNAGISMMCTEYMRVINGNRRGGKSGRNAGLDLDDAFATIAF